VTVVVHDSRARVREVRDTHDPPNVVLACRNDLQAELAFDSRWLDRLPPGSLAVHESGAVLETRVPPKPPEIQISPGAMTSTLWKDPTRRTGEETTCHLAQSQCSISAS
jgi:hypothetical protein